MRRFHLLVLLALGSCFASGCSSCESKSGDSADPTATAGEQQSPAAPGPPTGVVEGVILLAEGAELPSYPDPRAVAQPQIPETCTPPQLTDRQPVRVGRRGGLEGVLVQAAEFSATITREPQVHELTIRDCRLTPQFIAAVRGDTLRLENETDYPFLPTLGQSSMMRTLMKDETRDLPLDTGGIYNVTCGFAAPCGRTDVVVAYHPVNTVTGEDGRFRIDNVPAGEDVEIHAWHPLFEESMVHVTVAAGHTETVELTLTPAPTSATPPEAPDTAADEGADEGPAENRPELF